jgi:hypothetical protein
MMQERARSTQSPVSAPISTRNPPAHASLIGCVAETHRYGLRLREARFSGPRFLGAWAGVCEIVGCDVVIKDLQGAGPLAGSELCASGFCPRCGRGWDLLGSSGGFGCLEAVFFGVGKVVELNVVEWLYELLVVRSVG